MQLGVRAVKLGQISVCVFLCIDTGVILIGDAIQANKRLVLEKIKGYQVRDWIAGKCEIRISQIVYSTHMCERRLINV